MDTACQVYTKLLAQRGYGYPLWEPEPDEAGEVLIGDVGYILDGGFYRLFNCTLPAEHPANLRSGVPDGYVPFTYPKTLLHKRPRALEPKPLCSKNVTVLAAEGSLGSGIPGTPSVSAAIQFKCTDEQAAVLVLKRPGHRETLHPCLDLTQYIVKNHHQWYSFARDVCRLDIGEQDIIFVGGFIKTAEWALAVATHRAREGTLSFGGDFGPSAKTTFSVSASRGYSMSVEHRTGPHISIAPSRSDDETPFDQCVFLQYYKLKRRKWRTPQVIRAEGQPIDDPPPPDSPGTAGVQLGCANTAAIGEVFIERTPSVSSGTSMDPVDQLLDWMLDHDDVQSAVASHIDVRALQCSATFRFHELASLPQYLRQVEPTLTITNGGVCSLLHDALKENVWQSQPFRFLDSRSHTRRHSQTPSPVWSRSTRAKSACPLTRIYPPTSKASPLRRSRHPRRAVSLSLPDVTSAISVPLVALPPQTAVRVLEDDSDEDECDSVSHVRMDYGHDTEEEDSVEYGMRMILEFMRSSDREKKMESTDDEEEGEMGSHLSRGRSHAPKPIAKGR